jgi:hypothetical protein
MRDRTPRLGGVGLPLFSPHSIALNQFILLSIFCHSCNNSFQHGANVTRSFYRPLKFRYKIPDQLMRPEHFFNTWDVYTHEPSECSNPTPEKSVLENT